MAGNGLKVKLLGDRLFIRMRVIFPRDICLVRAILAISRLHLSKLTIFCLRNIISFTYDYQRYSIQPQDREHVDDAPRFWRGIFCALLKYE